jgi:hypothetical protein
VAPFKNWLFSENLSTPVLSSYFVNCLALHLQHEEHHIERNIGLAQRFLHCKDTKYCVSCSKLTILQQTAHNNFQRILCKLQCSSPASKAPLHRAEHRTCASVAYCECTELQTGTFKTCIFHNKERTAICSLYLLERHCATLASQKP